MELQLDLVAPVTPLWVSHRTATAAQHLCLEQQLWLGHNSCTHITSLLVYIQEFPESGKTFLFPFDGNPDLLALDPILNLSHLSSSAFPQQGIATHIA